MYKAGPLVGFDKAGGEERDVEVVALTAQRVRCRRSGKSLAGKAVDNRICLDPGVRREGLDQGFGNKQRLARWILSPIGAALCRALDLSPGRQAG